MKARKEEFQTMQDQNLMVCAVDHLHAAFCRPVSCVMRGDQLFAAINHQLKRGFGFQNEQHFRRVMAALIDTGLAVERTGRTLTAPMKELAFTLSSWFLIAVGRMEGRRNPHLKSARPVRAS